MASENAFATCWRSIPICAIWSGWVAVPTIACLVFGSWAYTLTEATCWTEVMRGRNDVRLTGHSSSTAPSRPGLRKYAFWSSTTNSNPQRSARRQMKSQSVSLSCWMKSCGSPLGSPSNVSPFSDTTFLTMSVAVWFWNTRTLRERCSRCARSYAFTVSAQPPAPNTGSSETTSPLNSVCGASCSRAPSRTSSFLPITNGCESIPSALGNVTFTVHTSGSRR